jgi:hypothetical protein
MNRCPARRLLGNVGVAFGLTYVYAAPAHADDARDRAARAYEDARKAFDGGAYQAAALGFERVFQVVPNGASMIAAGRAWEKASEPALAADDLSAAIRAGDLSADETAKVKERLSQFERVLGRVEVLGPNGTTVSVGHEEVVRTPAIVHARPGAVTLVVTLPDGSRPTRTVVAASGQTVTADFRQTTPVPAAAPPAPTQVTEPPSRPTNPVRTAAWITGGGAVAGGIAAAILAPLFTSKNNDWSASTKTDAGQRSEVVSLQIATDTAFFTACGLAVASATLFLVSARSTATPTTGTAPPSAPVLSAGPRWVGITGHF